VSTGVVLRSKKRLTRFKLKTWQKGDFGLMVKKKKGEHHRKNRMRWFGTRHAPTGGGGGEGQAKTQKRHPEQTCGRQKQSDLSHWVQDHRQKKKKKEKKEGWVKRGEEGPLFARG